MTADIRDQYAYLKPQPFVWLAVLGSALVHLGLVGLLVIGGILEENRVPEKRQAILTKLASVSRRSRISGLTHEFFCRFQVDSPRFDDYLIGYDRTR